MVFPLPYKKVRMVAVGIIAAFLFAGWFSINMHMSAKDMQDMGCILGITPDTSCMMNPGQHLAWWNHTFVGIPSGIHFLNYLSLLGAFVFLGYILLFLKSPYQAAGCRGFSSKDPPDASFHDFHLEYFAGGTAQPLFYA